MPALGFAVFHILIDHLVKRLGADRNAMLGAELESVQESWGGLDCQSTVARLEAAIDVLFVYPNTCLTGAFAPKDDCVVVNLRQVFHPVCLAIA